MATKRNQKNRVLFPFFLVAFTWQGRERPHARSTHAAGRAARARRPARTKVLRPPSLWLGSQLGDGDRARSKSWCDRSAQADRTQQPSSSVASGFVLFFPSSPRPRRFEFVTLLNSMNDGLHEGNQPGTKPFNGYKPALGCPSMHISCDPQDYLTFALMHSTREILAHARLEITGGTCGNTSVLPV